MRHQAYASHQSNTRHILNHSEVLCHRGVWPLLHMNMPTRGRSTFAGGPELLYGPTHSPVMNKLNTLTLLYVTCGCAWVLRLWQPAGRGCSLFSPDDVDGAARGWAAVLWVLCNFVGVFLFVLLGATATLAGRRRYSPFSVPLSCLGPPVHVCVGSSW